MKAMEVELQKARDEQAREKEMQQLSARGPSAPIATPGAGRQGGQTPRRTPARLGI